MPVKLIAFAFTVFAVTACAPRQLDAKKAQQTVDYLTSRQEPHKQLYDLMESGKWKPKEAPNPTQLLRSEFKIDSILAAFPNLSMKPDTTLDFVYYLINVGGWPVLYSRHVNAEPFDTFDTLTNAMPDAKSRAIISDTESQGFGFFFKDIEADGTQDSYFQLITLYLMGDQFFHIWHDAYHDERIVCSRSGLDRLFKNSDPYSKHGIPNDVRDSAYALQISPQVNIQDDNVVVSVVIFTMFGGFQRRIYTISRTPPYKLLNEQRQELINFHCGYVI